MNTPHLVECVLAGLALNDEACEAYPELGELRLRARCGGAPVPLQWALCVADLPLARGLIRHTALALLSLLDGIDEGWKAGERDGCPLWHTLQRAPPWLLLPEEPDDAEPDIALLLERDESYHGDWQALIEALHRAGSREWQWAIQRCRAMQAYEARHQVNLGDL
ncbi:MAG: hypothetical protein FJZ90_09580, partial [Chloroflexi bacterium]|nr:hypothetical protein [Chloroflexota bacterium]